MQQIIRYFQSLYLVSSYTNWCAYLQQETLIALPNDKESLSALQNDKETFISLPNDKETLIALPKGKETLIALPNYKDTFIALPNGKHKKFNPPWSWFHGLVLGPVTWFIVLVSVNHRPPGGG